MRLFVMKWERRWDDNNDYQDYYVPIGWHNVIMDGDGDSCHVYLGDQLIVDVFDVNIQQHYLEFLGFIRDNNILTTVKYQCHTRRVFGEYIDESTLLSSRT